MLKVQLIKIMEIQESEYRHLFDFESFALSCNLTTKPCSRFNGLCTTVFRFLVGGLLFSRFPLLNTVPLGHFTRKHSSKCKLSDNYVSLPIDTSPHLRMYRLLLSKIIATKLSKSNRSPKDSILILLDLDNIPASSLLAA